MEPGSEAVAERIDFVTNNIEPYVQIESLRNIVDYGGDEGQFFPPSYSGPKYVIDVSGKEMVEDATADDT